MHLNFHGSPFLVLTDSVDGGWIHDRILKYVQVRWVITVIIEVNRSKVPTLSRVTFFDESRTKLEVIQSDQIKLEVIQSLLSHPELNPPLPSFVLSPSQNQGFKFTQQKTRNSIGLA